MRVALPACDTWAVAITIPHRKAMTWPNGLRALVT